MMLLLALLVPWAANAQSSLCDPQDQCSITYVLSDSYGDGWNGGQIVVVDVLTGTNLATWTISSGATLEGTLDVCVGREIQFNYTPGSWAGENSWVIRDVAGTIIWEGSGSNGSSSQTYTVVCPTCLPPTALTVTLTSGDGTVATLSWTSDADAWQICLNGDETNLIPATTNPYTLTGLTPETTYTAKVRTNCGSEQSAWSNEVTFTPTDAYTLTVNDGTSTNSYVPYYAYYHDSQQRSEFIIPASSLSDLAWGTITSMKFYPNYTYTTSASIKVYLMEVEEETFSDVTFYGETDATVVYDGTLSISPNGMTIAFAGNGFLYGGGNLLVGFYQSAGGSGYYSTSTCPFYGVSATGASISQHSSYSGLRNFLPKTTFDYIPGEAPACMWPTNLAAGTPGPRSVELSWTENGTATNWQICVNGDEANPIAANTNPYTLTGLTPETDYTVKVRSNCGTDGYSDWSNEVSFTTDVLCPAPTNFVVSDITAFSANVSWNALSNVTLRYVANPNFFFQGFVTDAGAMADGADASWIKGASTTWGPSGNYAGGYYLADDFTVNTATSLTEIEVYGYQTGSTTESTFTGLYAMILSGNPMEGTVDTIWGDMTTNLMTSTSFTNCYRGSDGQTTATTRPIMAVTASGLNINLAAGTYWLVYGMTGTLSSGPWAVPYSDPVVGNIGDGLQYSSSGWAALTDSGSGAYGPAMKLSFGDIESFDWTTVNNISTGEYAMTNLDPETLYLVQVRANCGSEGNSNWVSTTFTTLPSCLFPTDLAVSNIEARQAVLAWTENGDATAWEVEVVGNTTTVLNATQNPYTLTGLNPETRYTVRVRSKCSNTDFSEWSLHATFTTDVACHAPTNLAFADITRISANVSWDGEADSYEMEYATGGASYLTYDFEDGTLQGWTNLIVNTDGGEWLHSNDNGGGYDYTTLAHSGTGFATCYSYVDGGSGAFDTDAYLVSPTSYSIDGNASLNFWYDMANDSYPEDFEVCVATVANPTASDFTAIWASGTAKGNNDIWKTTEKRQRNTRYDNWREVTLDLNAYAGQSIWIAFHDVNYDAYEVWIDDITVNTGIELIWTPVGTVTSPYLFNNLDPETTYMVRVRANCGEEDGYSAWLQGSFTTEEACPAPYALGATPYALSAELSWEGTSESYIVSYRRPEYEDGGLSETFGTTIPTGWTMYSGLLSAEGTATLTPATYGWSFGTGNNVFDNHARCNIYGNYQRWLVTPAFTLSSSTFTFDMALTVYTSSSSASPTPGNQPDDKFVVLVSTDNMATWTILRQWDNAGSEYVYDSITNDANGEAVSIDLSAFVGQTVRIAFYGESTVSNGDNNLHIDNVVIGNPQTIVDEWQTVTVDEAAATLTGLMPATIYEWKVQGNCGDFGMSEESAIVTFTTTNDACPVPTNLTVNNETLTATTADLSWNGSPDVESFTVRYRAPEYVVGGLSETFGTSVPTGWTMYTGLLSTVMENPTALTPGSSWAFGTNNGVFDNHARCNIYGNYQRWLVTPAFTLSSSTFTFDMALTVYTSSSSASPTPGNQPDDKFVVLVSTDNMATWTILRQWDNAGSEYVYDSITNDANGEAVSIDLSAFVGQTVRIAFYGESTVSNGDNNLHIDNVVIGNPQVIPATDWQTVTTSDMNVTLTGLTPETPYEAQVKADCSDPEAWSNTVTFTTLEQTTVTQTIALTAGEVNYCSFYVDITLADLQTALTDVLGTGSGVSITIKSQTQSSKLTRGRWTGQLTTLDLGKMYKIFVNNDCEITLEGMVVDPAEHQVTIGGGGNPTWIAFPFSASMTLTEAFAGFAVNGDAVKSKTQNANYTRGRWTGQLQTLEPGQGYIYKSASNAADRVFVYPTNNKK